MIKPRLDIKTSIVNVFLCKRVHYPPKSLSQGRGLTSFEGVLEKAPERAAARSLLNLFAGTLLRINDVAIAIVVPYSVHEHSSCQGSHCCCHGRAYGQGLDLGEGERERVSRSLDRQSLRNQSSSASFPSLRLALGLIHTR